MINNGNEHRYPLIFNPNAKSAKADGAKDFIMKKAGRFAIFASNSAKDAERLAAKFAEMGEKTVIAAGGDGTMNSVIKGLAGSDTALGILPTGTMNVFARELGLPMDALEKSFRFIDEGETTDVDLFEVNGAPFVQMAGVGFDAQVIAETNLDVKKALGPLAYLMAAVKVLGDKPPKMTVEFAEGNTAEGVAVLVGNGSLYGGHLRVFAKAENADGLLDVLVFKESGYKLVTEAVGGIVKGGFDDNMETVDYFQSSGLKVTSDREVPVEVDGEFLCKTKVANFVDVPRRLKVYAPKDPSMPKWEEVLRKLSPWAE